MVFQSFDPILPVSIMVTVSEPDQSGLDLLVRGHWPESNTYCAVLRLAIDVCMSQLGGSIIVLWSCVALPRIVK